MVGVPILVVVYIVIIFIDQFGFNKHSSMKEKIFAGTAYIISLILILLIILDIKVPSPAKAIESLVMNIKKYI